MSSLASDASSETHTHRTCIHSKAYTHSAHIHSETHTHTAHEHNDTHTPHIYTPVRAHPPQIQLRTHLHTYTHIFVYACICLHNHPTTHHVLFYVRGAVSFLLCFVCYAFFAMLSFRCIQVRRAGESGQPQLRRLVRLHQVTAHHSHNRTTATFTAIIAHHNHYQIPSQHIHSQLQPQPITPVSQP
jgi:hypothetical protein